MMTNNQSWHSAATANHFSNSSPSHNEKATTGAEAGKSVTAVSFQSVKILEAKRYSFDDNGGGYQGL